MDELLDSFVWVKLKGDGAFLKVKETLQRIGIAKDNTLIQSVHLLHKKGRYAIVHFKELFALDGKATNFTANDIARRNTIANLLADWDLIELEDPSKTTSPLATINQIKIIPYKDRDKWTFEAKYTLGKHKKKD